MSQLPKKNRPVRKTPADTPPESAGYEPDDYDEYDYDYEEEAPPPRRRGNPEPVAQSRAPRGGRGGGYDPRAGAGRAGRAGNTRPRYVEPKRDMFPYIMGALAGAVVVALLGVAYLLGTSNKGTPTTAQAPGLPASTSIVDQQPTAGVPGTDPPRMPLAEFKALYDDPAKRPMIIDVRDQNAFNEGHIAGAVSFPEADVDARAVKLPKDSLIIAYCQ